jgi:hypothetical protein
MTKKKSSDFSPILWPDGGRAHNIVCGNSLISDKSIPPRPPRPLIVSRRRKGPGEEIKAELGRCVITKDNGSRRFTLLGMQVRSEGRVVNGERKRDTAMLRLLKWALPMTAAMGLMIGLAVVSAKGAEEAAKGTITGKVVDKDGTTAVPDATVTLTKPRDPNAPRTRPEPLATATTDKDGKFVLEFEKAKVPDGEYNVGTNVQGKGMGREKVKITGVKAEPAEVTIKLAARQGRGGGGGGGGM